MKRFDEHVFQIGACRQQLDELKTLLDSGDSLGENDRILPFFRARRDLCALIGSYHGRIVRFDRIAFEYDVFGDFVADLVIGDSENGAFNFIEFEDATPNSLFVKRGRKTTREWSSRLEHGFGQIIDWFYKLDDRRKSDDFADRFGMRSIDVSGTLIVGRDQHIDTGERFRLEWRRQHVIVNSKHIKCITYDELLSDLRNRIDIFADAAQSKDP